MVHPTQPVKRDSKSKNITFTTSKYEINDIMIENTYDRHIIYYCTNNRI